jgi:hypothetical protein
MSFGADLRRFVMHTQQMTQEVFRGVAHECHRSIQEGSEITGAPGQPVGGHQPGRTYVGGALKASWILGFDSPSVASITTNLAYAKQIEDGSREGRELTLWSPVGGWHSVKLTVVGYPRIVAYVTREVTGNG